MQAWLLVDRPMQARNFLKVMVVNTLATGAHAITGSAMCTVWSGIVQMPTHGVHLLLHYRRLNLPAAVSEAAVDETWMQLRRLYPQLPTLLRKYLLPQPAMMVFVAIELLQEQPGIDDDDEEQLASFVARCEKEKLLYEVGDMVSKVSSGHGILKC